MNRTITTYALLADALYGLKLIKYHYYEYNTQNAIFYHPKSDLLQAQKPPIAG